MGLLRRLHKRVRGLAKAPLRAGAKLAGKLPGGKKLNRAIGRIPGANRIIGGPLERGKGKKRGLRGSQPGRAMASRPGGGGLSGGIRSVISKKAGGY